MADDTIYRQAAIDAIAEMGFQNTSTVKAILCRLETLPSAQPEQRIGRWIWKKVHEDEYHNSTYQCFCSICSVEAYEFNQQYCHRCGAQMEG